MSLRLGVDAWNLLGDRRGIGRYTRALLKHWRRLGNSRVQLTLLVPQWPAWITSGRYRKEAGIDGVRVAHRNAVAKLKLDAVWFPWNGLSWECPCTAVATLHDASRFALPPADAGEAAREQRPFRLAAQRAQRIITDSQFSKEELVKYLQLDPKKVDVVHLGVEPSFGTQRAMNDNRSRYILFVGEPERRKGVDTLIEAMTMLSDPIRSIDLVIAGNSDEYPLPAIPDVVRVKAIGYVDDARLAELYAGAAVFVYPSRYEGFGLPILESMQCGAPVVASDIPSSREAAGEAALFVAAGDARALADALTRVLTDGQLAERLRALGRSHAAAMTWERTASRTLASIELAIEEARAPGAAILTAP